MRMIALLSLVIASSVVSSSYAGPDWDEGNKDAGQTPPTARSVSSGSGGSVTKISGATSTALVAGGDNVDLYEIQFDPQASGWIIDCQPGWDVQLFLFRKYSDDVVHLLAAADDISANNNGAKLTNFMVSVDTNARHYLAVTGPGMTPGYINPTSGAFQACYSNGLPVNWTGVLTPDSPRFDNWIGTATAAGPYQNSVSGLRMILSDSCADAALLASGENSLNTLAATTDPLAYDSAGCSFNGSSGMGKDVWFVYDPECAGSAIVSTCGLINFDSVIVVYEVEAGGSCPVDATPHACNDDGAGCTGYSSRVTFDVDTCHTYYIRVGGYCGSPGAGGVCATASSGYGNVSLTPPSCGGGSQTADINGDGIVDGADLTLLLTLWGTDGTGG